MLNHERESRMANKCLPKKNISSSLIGLSVSQTSLSARTARLPGVTGEGLFPLWSVLKMDKGYFKIWRRLKEHPIMQDGKALSVFIYCLLHAEWKDGRKVKHARKIITLKAGQLTAGSYQIAHATGLSRKNVRTVTTNLKSLYGILAIEPANDNSLITILNWNKYQSETASTSASGWPATGQQPATSEEYKHIEYKNKNLMPVSKFESIWDQYPLKDGKKQALKHFQATVKTDEDFARLGVALENYKAHLAKNTWKHAKGGSTWFNNWQDWENWSEPVKEETIEERDERILKKLSRK